jgi:transposase
MSDLGDVIEKDSLISLLLLRMEELETRLQNAEVRIIELETENRLLKERLITKNSRNSSKPPSTEIISPKRTKSLRGSSDRKRGGQPGHKGSNLKMVAEPDVIDQRMPKYCNCCGSDLSDTPSEFVDKRQVIDIPPIIPVVTEQQIYKCTCICGHTTSGQFSPNANAQVGYGPNTEALVAYLHTRQYLPVARMGELFKDVLGMPISTGGISHLLKRFVQKATPVHELIKQRLQNSPFVGSDETGCKVNGKLHWFWTWQSPRLTYIAHSGSRGKKAIEDNFPDGFPNAILGSDAWKPQLNTLAKGHQLCTAHMLRELNYLMELDSKESWSKDFSELLRQALKLRYAMDTRHVLTWEEQLSRIMDSFQKLLAEPPDPDNKKAYTFFKRVLKNRDYIFVFLTDLAVPPDNNSSERAIRNIKVKQKVSGQFKADHSAMGFAKIRSVIDTTIKNSQNVLEGLRLIARNEFSLQD